MAKTSNPANLVRAKSLRNAHSQLPESSLTQLYDKIVITINRRLNTITHLVLTDRTVLKLHGWIPS